MIGRAPVKKPGEGGSPERRKGKSLYFAKKKFCWFCKHQMFYIDFKETNLLRNYIHENGKIISGRSSGTCHYPQTRLTWAIKRARPTGLMPLLSR